MGKFIAIASGKGGTGKTTIAINLSLAFVNFGKEIILLDADLRTSNIGLHLGTPILPVTLHEVVEGAKKIEEAFYIHPSGLKIIPASISLEKAKGADMTKLKDAIIGLNRTRETVILDIPSGIGEEVSEVLRLADETMVVTNPDIVSVTDALKLIKIAEECGSTIVGVILNRVKNDGLELSVNSIETMLDCPVISIIPEDVAVKKALNMKQPLVYAYPNAKATLKFKKLAASLMGSKYESKLKKR